MLAGVRQVCIITSAIENKRFQELLGDGSQWGMDLHFEVQDQPNGIAESFVLAQEFIGKDNCFNTRRQLIFWY